MTEHMSRNQKVRRVPIQLYDGKQIDKKTVDIKTNEKQDKIKTRIPIKLKTNLESPKKEFLTYKNFLIQDIEEEIIERNTFSSSVQNSSRSNNNDNNNGDKLIPVKIKIENGSQKGTPDKAEMLRKNTYVVPKTVLKDMNNIRKCCMKDQTDKGGMIKTKTLSMHNIENKNIGIVMEMTKSETSNKTNKTNQDIQEKKKLIPDIKSHSDKSSETIEQFAKIDPSTSESILESNEIDNRKNTDLETSIDTKQRNQANVEENILHQATLQLEVTFCVLYFLLL